MKLTAELGVVLNNPQGGEIWKSGPGNGEAAYGFMNDTGNFCKDINGHNDAKCQKISN